MRTNDVQLLLGFAAVAMFAVLSSSRADDDEDKLTKAIEAAKVDVLKIMEGDVGGDEERSRGPDRRGKSQRSESGGNGGEAVELQCAECHRIIHEDK